MRACAEVGVAMRVTSRDRGLGEGLSLGFGCRSSPDLCPTLGNPSIFYPMSDWTKYYKTNGITGVNA